MAARFNNTGDLLNRTGSLIDYNSNYTICWWGKVSVDTNSLTTMMSLNDNGTSDFDLAGHNSDGTTTRLVVRVSTNITIQTGSNLTAGTLYHFAMRRTSTTSLQLLVDGVVDVTNTRNVGGRTAILDHHLGDQIGTGARFDGTMEAVREWSTNLSDAEIVTESNSSTVVRTSNLVNDVPLTSDAVALTGTNFTESGTITYEADRSYGGGPSTSIPVIMNLYKRLRA